MEYWNIRKEEKTTARVRIWLNTIDLLFYTESSKLYLKVKTNISILPEVILNLYRGNI